MKKIIAITLAVLMAAMTFIFAGCGDKKTATDSDLEYVKNNGKLVIGITDFDLRLKGKEKDDTNKAIDEIKEKFAGANITVKP